jgi:hypothetical protein
MKYNILSYFITDQLELALYKQVNRDDAIEIYYKDELLYKIMHYNSHSEIIWNLKKNILKNSNSGRLVNYKIESSKASKYKLLYYNKNKKVLSYEDNYIYYDFIYNKYFLKTTFDYVIDGKLLFTNAIFYYNNFKFVYRGCSEQIKYKCVNICIINKYELYYNNRFFNLYFGHN